MIVKLLVLKKVFDAKPQINQQTNCTDEFSLCNLFFVLENLRDFLFGIKLDKNE